MLTKRNEKCGGMRSKLAGTRRIKAFLFTFTYFNFLCSIVSAHALVTRNFFCPFCTVVRSKRMSNAVLDYYMYIQKDRKKLLLLFKCDDSREKSRFVSYHRGTFAVHDISTHMNVRKSALFNGVRDPWNIWRARSSWRWRRTRRLGTRTRDKFTEKRNYIFVICSVTKSVFATGWDDGDLNIFTAAVLFWSVGRETKTAAVCCG